MPTDFIPRTDAGVLAFGLNFSTIVSSAPTAVGLTTAIATILAAKQAAYAASYALAVDPATRGGANILAKDTARRDLIAYIRLLARTIQGTLTVTNAQRYALGLTVRDVIPSPIPAPAFPPDVDILSVAGRTVRLRVHSSTSPRRGKPAGVAGASVFSYVGATPPDSVAAWKFEGNTTRTRFDILFDAGIAPGAIVWVCAFWFNPRAQSGPASEPVSTRVPGGLASEAA